MYVHSITLLNLLLNVRYIARIEFNKLLKTEKKHYALFKTADTLFNARVFITYLDNY